MGVRPMLSTPRTVAKTLSLNWSSLPHGRRWGGRLDTAEASSGMLRRYRRLFVLLAFGLLFPRRTIVLLIPPLPMPAIVFVILYALLELFSGVFGTDQGVAHFAHLGGMIGAYITLRHWRSRQRAVYYS